jgi:hypothetical protein
MQFKWLNFGAFCSHKARHRKQNSTIHRLVRPGNYPMPEGRDRKSKVLDNYPLNRSLRQLSTLNQETLMALRISSAPDKCVDGIGDSGLKGLMFHLNTRL